VTARRPSRVVAALAAVERTGPVHEALAGAGYAVEGVLVQAARLSPLPGGVHRLGALNPVFLLWGTREPARHGTDAAHWADGPWADGPWADGPWADGHWADGHWVDGHWVDGHRVDGHRVDGHRADEHWADGAGG
jgi:hypothetical protein